jgi:hypothetical protein
MLTIDATQRPEIEQNNFAAKIFQAEGLAGIQPPMAGVDLRSTHTSGNHSFFLVRDR